MKYQLGYWCPRGDGHADLLGDEDGGSCGSKGWPLVIDVDPEDADMLPEWAQLAHHEDCDRRDGGRFSMLPDCPACLDDAHNGRLEEQRDFLAGAS